MTNSSSKHLRNYSRYIKPTTTTTFSSAWVLWGGWKEVKIDHLEDENIKEMLVTAFFNLAYFGLVLCYSFSCHLTLQSENSDKSFRVLSRKNQYAQRIRRLNNLLFLVDIAEYPDLMPNLLSLKGDEQGRGYIKYISATLS